ncbi:HDOD domain-containing protein [bacterium]|nr:HDOD domain-containing protein [bacterium]
MTTDSQEKNSGSASTDFIEKLKKALSRDGDFPASARVVSELREVISKPESTTNQVAEIILREPSLGTRVLHLVNSSFYRRAKPIMTVSQAVIQIGMRPLAELCSGLVLLQKFIPAARKGGPFAKCLKKTITTSLLTSALSAEINTALQDGSEKKSATKSKTPKDEAGYLTGTFAEMGILLLAYYFPKLYESAERRAMDKQVPLSQSVKELVGLSPLEISIEVLDELKLPGEYKRILSEAAELADSPPPEGDAHAESMVYALYAGRKLSEAINEYDSGEVIEDAVVEVNSKLPFETLLLSDVLGQLADTFRDYCSSLELQLPGIDDKLEQYRVQLTETSESQTEEVQFNQEQQFLDFVEEIRAAVENREPSASIITTVMETCAWGLRFDRVFLLLFGRGKQQLHGRMLLGHIPDFDPKSCVRDIKGGPQTPEAVAIRESRPVYRGEPLFEDGWPFAAIPVGFEKRTVGILYADRISTDDSKELNAREEAAIGVLAELLDRSIALNR